MKQKTKRYWKYFFRLLLWVILSIVAMVILLFAYFNLPGQERNTKAQLGITYSQKYAEQLSLDWKETYVKILDDIGVKKVRLPVYWDLVEPSPGEYHFSDIDWLLAEARKRNVEVVLSVGQRVPRWPECHIPKWAWDDDALRKERLVELVQVVIEKYKKDHPEIVMWQVENEPFLPFFGICPPFDEELLRSEVAAARATDTSRPILLTDSGELSLWYKVAGLADVFGTTMYRNIWKEGVGYFEYPVGPNFFRFKEKIVRSVTGQENFIVIELQAEPWANSWITEASLEEQFKTMNENRLRENVEYAQDVGFDEIYLWGAEWWYWMKVHHEYPAVWEEAKKIFRESTEEIQENRVIATINGTTFHVEVADTDALREQGLSGRESLDESEGMLFVFDKQARHLFWMKDMNFSIDILWLDEGYRIVDMDQNISPKTYPKTFQSDVPVRYVLEVSSGWAERNRIQIGDTVQVKKGDF